MACVGMTRRSRQRKLATAFGRVKCRGVRKRMRTAYRPRLFHEATDLTSSPSSNRHCDVRLDRPLTARSVRPTQLYEAASHRLTAYIRFRPGDVESRLA